MEKIPEKSRNFVSLEKWGTMLWQIYNRTWWCGNTRFEKQTLPFYFQLGHNNYVNVAITSQHRLSGQSYESGVSGVSVTSSRQSYHSNSSSSSLGSLDRLEESGYSSTVNVHELFQAGLSVSTFFLFPVVSCMTYCLSVISLVTRESYNIVLKQVFVEMLGIIPIRDEKDHFMQYKI